jgi:hypothetical protein
MAEGSFLGLSKDKSKSKSQTTNTLDPQYQNLVYGNVQRAQQLADAAMTPYPGDRVAGFNADQQASFGAMRNIYDNAIGAGTLSSAIQQAGFGANYVPEQVASPNLSDIDISRYFDPFVNNVVDATNADLERARLIENLQNDSRASQAGAFGGTGAEVARSLTNDNFLRAKATNSATLRSQAFQNAQSMGVGDLSRRLAAAQSNQSAGLQAAQSRIEAAGILGQLSGQELDQAMTRAGVLGTIGSAQQALQQQQLDAGLEDWRYAQERQAALQELVNAATNLVPQTGTSFGTEKRTNIRAEGQWTP